MAAAKPARSPTTPPPSADQRGAALGAKLEQPRQDVLQRRPRLVRSPSGTRIDVASRAPRADRARRAAARGDARATVALVTIDRAAAARRPPAARRRGRASPRRRGSGSCAPRARRRASASRELSSVAVASGSERARRSARPVRDPTSIDVVGDLAIRAHRAARTDRTAAARGSAAWSIGRCRLLPHAMPAASPASREDRSPCRSPSGARGFAGRRTAPPPVASTTSVSRVELVDHRFLAIAESDLALDLEDRRNRHAEPCLELVIGVDERACGDGARAGGPASICRRP